MHIAAAVTAVHGLHLQDYRATNLCAIECARSAHLNTVGCQSVPTHAAVKVHAVVLNESVVHIEVLPGCSGLSADRSAIVVVRNLIGN